MELHVVGLDVAVDDVFAVSVGEGRLNSANEIQGFISRNLAVSQETIAPRLAFDDRHDVMEISARSARIEKRNDVRMI